MIVFYEYHANNLAQVKNYQSFGLFDITTHELLKADSTFINSYYHLGVNLLELYIR